MTTDDVVAGSTGRLRDLWAADRPAFGLWGALGDPVVAEVLAASPADYVCLDLQHGIGSPATLPGLAQAMRVAGRAPLVRPPWNTPADVMRALDAGACGVVVPMVSTPEQAAAAASACRYPPRGTRSWGPLWSASRPTPTPAEQDDATLCVVMVETREGLDAVEDIAAVDGVDAVYVGPNDLALTTGYGRATYRDEPAVAAMVDRVVAACAAAGTVAGLHCSDVAMAAEWAARGVRMLTVAQDASLLRSAVSRTWQALGEATGTGAAL